MVVYPIKPGPALELTSWSGSMPAVARAVLRASKYDVVAPLLPPAVVDSAEFDSVPKGSNSEPLAAEDGSILGLTMSVVDVGK